ncbi:MAG: flavodoxin family protein [Firmicutes bacterium]|nr:flavodoxin family protein [Bacillota bacterium]
MKVLLHDLKNIDLTNKADQVIVADGKYAPCQGCFKCWTKHPATCALKDSLQEMCRILGQADELTIITENYYGGYSPNVKRLLDRSIGTSTPMSTYRGGLMHHTLRYWKHDSLRVIVYGDIVEAEKETWRQMVKANSLNNGFTDYSVEFMNEWEGSVL